MARLNPAVLTLIGEGEPGLVNGSVGKNLFANVSVESGGTDDRGLFNAL
jgi:hypothetical protein